MCTQSISFVQLGVNPFADRKINHPPCKTLYGQNGASSRVIRSSGQNAATIRVIMSNRDECQTNNIQHQNQNSKLKIRHDQA
jgi:hypothetical protein